jgi:hypothetical protein
MFGVVPRYALSSEGSLDATAFFYKELATGGSTRPTERHS